MLGTADNLYTNYHYSGDVEWTNQSKLRSLDDGSMLAVVTDGLRSAEDFNHNDGMNVLRADGSVRWKDDVEGVRADLPQTDADVPSPEYVKLWDKIVPPPR